LIDTGSPLLIVKRRAAAGGRSDIELVDPLGILFANGMVDVDELATLRLIERWVGMARRARGLGDGHVGRLWAQLLSGARGGRSVAPATGERTPADTAWRRLLQLHELFAEIDELPTLATIIMVCGGERGPCNEAELADLKVGAAGIEMFLRTRRRQRPRRQQRLPARQ
jgi:hypothetical protein